MNRHATNNVMPNLKRKMRTDKLFSAIETFLWMVVLAIAGSLMFVYVVDNLIPVTK